MLSQQLADAAGGQGVSGEVVYLDLSPGARAVAEARAAARGLANIRFVTGSLLDLGKLGLGSFDYIDCCGVLHHLPDPQAGLLALTEVLAEDGGMGLMVYGTFGRSGVYPLQAVLRAMVGDRPLAEQISFTRRLLANLPSTNLFSRNPGLRDHTGSDAELVDLLLHSQDRSYTVEEIAGLLSAAGLNLISFIEPLRYEPGTYLKDPVLLRQLASLSPEGRAARSEEHTSELQSLMRISYAVFCLKKKTKKQN